jgi:type II secretory ATPase GspE/PulE/Tfp pilus assembly ATPase PilB-like protein
MAGHEDNTGLGIEAAAPNAVLLAEESAASRPALANGQTGNRAPSLADEELAAAIHAELAKRLGQPGLVGELGGNPKAELALMTAGRIEDSILGEVHAWASGLVRVDDEDLGTFERFPEVGYDFLANHDCLPIAWNGSEILLAVATPYGLGQIAYLWQTIFQRAATFVLARPAVVERYLTSTYDVGQADTAAVGDATEETLRDLAREAPIVRLVNDMFNRATEMGASDIHVEPGEDELAIRFRVDGVLQTVQTPPMNQYPAIASRIKLLAGMNIAERRLPQDGRIDLTIAQQAIDVRVSTVPSMHGESIVLRLLQKESAVFDLTHIGMPAAMRDDFQRLFNMPHGMILVVGPTGSGKSTTLYCVMKMLNSDERKIITVEDPVEYQLPGLTQIQVRANIGLTFAKGLRSIVRQDPDVILVGEIRDMETAEIAIHAALTGHLVLSTLHTNDAAGAISRLLEMGIESFLISSSLLGVMSQRLVRRICPECGGSGRVAEPGGAEGQTRRCRNCLGSGYRGRVGIFEMLLVDDDIRKAVNEHRDSNEIAAIARRHGMRSLREDGRDKVRQNITTEAEVARVCQLDLVE